MGSPGDPSVPATVWTGPLHDAQAWRESVRGILGKAGWKDQFPILRRFFGAAFPERPNTPGSVKDSPPATVVDSPLNSARPEAGAAVDAPTEPGSIKTASAPETPVLANPALEVAPVPAVLPLPAKNASKVPRCVAVSELAESLDMSPRWVRDHIKAGDFEAHRFGNKIVVTLASIETFLKNRRVGFL